MSDAIFDFPSPNWSGWDISTTVEWLLLESRQCNNILEFTDTLCLNLRQAGVSIRLLSFRFQTLHPLIADCSFTWTSKNGKATEACLPHECGIREQMSYESHSTKTLFSHPISDNNSLVLPIPLSVDNSSVLVIEFESPYKPQNLDEDKFRFLSYLITPTIEVLFHKRVTVTLLETYIGTRAGKRVLEGQIKRGDAETISAAIWMCDLRDFTHYSSTLESSVMVQMMNEYFEIVFDAITKYDGEVLRFIGDSVLATFSSENNHTANVACERAYDAAQDAVLSQKKINLKREKQNIPPINFGVGLNFGEVTYGNIGAPSRLDFSVMGSAVNLASRIEELTKQLDYQILTSQSVANAADRDFYFVGEYNLKGVDQKEQIYATRSPH